MRGVIWYVSFFFHSSLSTAGVMDIKKWSDLPPRVLQLRNTLLAELQLRFPIHTQKNELWAIAAMCSPMEKNLEFLNSEIRGSSCKVFSDFVVAMDAKAAVSSAPSTEVSEAKPAACHVYRRLMNFLPLVSFVCRCFIFNCRLLREAPLRTRSNDGKTFS